MRDGMVVVDSDRHVVEPVAAWVDRLAPELRGLAPRLVEADGEVYWAILEGRRLQHRYDARARAEVAKMMPRVGFRAAADHLRHMDGYGIDVAVMLPTLGLYVLAIEEMEAEVAAAFARAYNDWLLEFCAAASGRLVPAAALALHDPRLALAEATRMADLGVRAIVVRPNPVRGRLLGDAAYGPLWGLCEARSIAVVCHEGTHAHLPTAGADRFSSRFAQHACSHPMEQMMAFLGLLEGGVFERYPGLRVGFFEAGAGWVPYWLWRLDEEYRCLGGEVRATVKRAPSAYFKRQCWVAVEPGEPNLAAVVESVGADNLLFGTDFPHPDHDADAADAVFELGAALGGEVLRKIVSDNPRRFYGL